MCDIDDTLIMHVSTGQNQAIKDPIRTRYIYVKVNAPMVRLLEEELARGSQVCVWSRGGYQWAVNVLEALGLDKLPQEIVVLTKPYAYFDDKDVSEWMKDRVYIAPDTHYKG
jgi:hypothetical protein